MGALVQCYYQWIWLFLSFEIVPLQSLSRYALDTKYVDYPLPLDICIQSGADYVIYSCDTTTDPHTLIKSNHSNYASCNSPHPAQTYVTQNISAPLFNCIGQNNYILLHQFETEHDCVDIESNHNYIASYIATDICHNHIRYSCNEYYAHYNMECGSDSQLSATYISRSACNNNKQVMVDCVEDDDSMLHNESAYMYSDDLTFLDLLFSMSNYTETQMRNSCGFELNATNLLQNRITSETFCGIRRDENDYITSIQLENIRLYRGLPSTICNLERLSVLSIRHKTIEDINHSWTVPQCMDTDLPLLSELTLINTTLRGSIESMLKQTAGPLKHLYLENNPFITGSIASNVCNLSTFHIVNMPHIEGVIPECIFIADSSAPYSHFHIASTSLSGNIPHSICNARFLSFRLSDNPSITGSIPSDCEHTKLTEFTLMEMSGLRGTIPDWVFCDQASLEWIDIRNTNNFVTQQIPSCFSDAKPVLETLIISKTSFYGIFPALPFSLKLSIVNIAHNAFKGALSELFANYISINSAEIINDLWCILINDNNFASEDDLAKVMEFIWSQWNVTLFSIANNPNITGQLGMIQTEYNEDTMALTHSTQSIFMAHNCDIYGSIPNVQMPPHLQWFTLFDNRLSGSIPDDIGDVNATALTPVILTGNILHSTRSNGLPLWMSNSPFRTAPNLYSVTFQHIISLALLCISAVGIIVTLSAQVKHWKAKRANSKAKRANSKANREERDTNPFFGRIEYIYWEYGSFGMLFWIVFLLIFYPFSANYYQSVKLESLFTLNWYYHSSKGMDVVLALASIGFQLVILNMIVHVVTSTNEFNEDHSTIIRSETMSPVAVHSENMTTLRKCYHSLVFFLNVIIYIAGVAVICSYFVIQSLPEDNILRINETISSILSKAMALFLMMFNKYSIRNLVHSFVTWRQYEDWYRVKQKMIIIIHVVNCVVIPFVAAVVFLQSCGRHWVLFWSRCNNAHLREIFDVSVEIMTDRYTMEFDVLSSSEICDVKGLWSADMKWNKCIRSFFYNWSFVILYKVLYEIIGSLLGLFWRLLKLKLCPCFKKSRKWRLDISNYNIKLMTNLIISITFSFYSPLIIPIYLAGVILIKYLHKVMMSRYGMTLHAPCSTDDNSYHLPVPLITFGVVFNQLTVLIFLSFCVYSLFPATMFFVSTMIMNYAVVKNVRIHNRKMKNKILDPIKPINATVVLSEQKKEAKKMLNVSRKRLSDIHEDEEQFDDELHVEIVASGDNDVDTGAQPELKEEEETDMKSYHQWVREMREKMNNTASYSTQSIVSNDTVAGTPVPNDNVIAVPNMHQTQISGSESQHYSIELSDPNDKRAHHDQNV